MSEPLRQWDNTSRSPKLRLVTRQVHWPDQVYQAARSKWIEWTQAVFMRCALEENRSRVWAIKQNMTARCFLSPGDSPGLLLVV